MAAALGHARDINGLLIDPGLVQTKSSDGEIGVLETPTRVSPSPATSP
jgi:hypothetical protein